MLERLNRASTQPAGVAAPAGIEERRQGERHISVLRVAKLHRGDAAELCVVRNISAGGLMLQAYSDLEIGGEVAVEVNEGQPLRGRVRWIRDTTAGMQFDAPIDVEHVLAGGDPLPPNHTPRPARIGVEIPAVMRVGAAYKLGTLNNISLGGAKVATNAPLSPKTELVLSVRGLPAIAGSVRWQNESLTGIVFDVRLPLATLADWVPRVRLARLA